jgi:hypothetical protein
MVDKVCLKTVHGAIITAAPAEDLEREPGLAIIRSLDVAHTGIQEKGPVESLETMTGAVEGQERPISEGHLAEAVIGEVLVETLEAVLVIEEDLEEMIEVLVVMIDQEATSEEGAMTDQEAIFEAEMIEVQADLVIDREAISKEMMIVEVLEEMIVDQADLVTDQEATSEEMMIEVQEEMIVDQADLVTDQEATSEEMMIEVQVGSMTDQEEMTEEATSEDQHSMTDQEIILEEETDQDTRISLKSSVINVTRHAKCLSNL